MEERSGAFITACNSVVSDILRAGIAAILGVTICKPGDVMSFLGRDEAVLRRGGSNAKAMHSVVIFKLLRSTRPSTKLLST